MFNNFLLTSYMTIFISHFIQEQGKNINGYKLDYVSSVNTASLVLRKSMNNDLKIIEKALENGEKEFLIEPNDLYKFIPWWLEPINNIAKKEYILLDNDSNNRIYNISYKCSLLMKNGNRFYPVFINSCDMNFIKKYDIIIENSNENKIVFYKTLLDKKLDVFLKEINSNGYGSLKTQRIVRLDYASNGNNITSNPKSAKNNTHNSRSIVETKKDISNPKPEKERGLVPKTYLHRFINQYCWFVPLNEEEKSRFSKVLDNQGKILDLIIEYDSLGFLDILRKKEIIKIIASLERFTSLVISLSCINRFKDYYAPYMKCLEHSIMLANNKLNNLKISLNQLSFNDFKLKKAINDDIKRYKKIIEELNNLYKNANARIEEFKIAYDKLIECLNEY